MTSPIPADTLEKILYAGSLAPSGHNCQPWRFRVQAETVQLVTVADPSLHNWRQCGSFVAHGALLENLSVAARALGYEPRITLFPDAATPDLVASITFEPAAPRDERLAAAIPLRCTNRKPYRPVPLTPTQQRELLHTAEEVGGAELRLYEHPSTRAELARIGALNEGIMFSTPALHRWFFEHLRWTEQDERATTSGLYLKTLELARPQEAVLKVFQTKWGERILNGLGFPKLIVRDNTAINSAAAAIGVILIPRQSDRAFIQAGRLLERVWLKATSWQLSLQPLIGTTCLILRALAGGADGLSPAHVALLTEADRHMREVCQLDRGTIVGLFRIGTSDPPSARSSRYPLATLLGEERR